MNRKTTKKVDESTLTTLCAVCRGAFLDAKGVHLRRADPRQLVKDVCTYASKAEMLRIDMALLVSLALNVLSGNRSE